MPTPSFIEGVITFFMSNQDLFTLYVNSLLLLLTGSVGTIYAIRWFNGLLSGFARYITGGISLTALGIFTTKLIWIIEHNSGFLIQDNAQIYDHITGLSFIPVTMIIIGYLLHISPYLKQCTQKQWILKTILGLIIFFFFVAFSQSFVHYQK